MCGLAGILERDGTTASRELLSKMGQALAHRGPEDEGIFAEKNIGFVHRRLKIIDIETGNQPVFAPDRKSLVLLNGEIYNYQDLRAGLEKRGAKFHTQSDTEVLIHLYRERGDLSFLDELNGMFVFVIQDLERGLTWIARDRTGEKPLYYADLPQRFAFASELPALARLPGMPREIDPAAVDCYFRYGYIPAPLSIHTAIRKLEPGCYLRIEGKSVIKKRYWEIPLPNPKPADPERTYEEFKSLLSDSVRLRMVADVPVGAFLSGGVDSSVVVALMKRYTSLPIETFTIGFGAGSFDESPISTQVARELGTNHHVEHLDRFDPAAIPGILRQFGEPFADSSSIPVYYLSRGTRKTVKVALSGDGADELLGGYNRYVAAQTAAPWLKIPSAVRPDFLLEWIRWLPESHEYYGASPVKKARKFARFLQEVGSAENGLAPVFFTDPERGPLYSEAFRSRLAATSAHDPVREIIARYRSLDLTTRMLWSDFSTYLPDDIHVKVDRMSMAHALEVRTPFMDHRLIEFLSRVPMELKLKNGRTKIMLRRLLAEVLPGHEKRPKHGFEAPVASWIRGELRGPITELIHSPVAREFLDPAAFQRLLDRHCTGREDLSVRIWSVYAFLVWADANARA